MVEGEAGASTKGDAAVVREQGGDADAGGWLSSAAHELKERVEDAAADVAEVVYDAAGYVEGALAPKVAVFADLSWKFENEVDLWLRKQIMKVLVKVIDRLPAIIKGSLNTDPDMIQWVWHRQCRLFDKGWPDLRKELLSDLEESIGVKPVVSKLLEPDTPGPDCFRRFFRYHLMPYDKSLWGAAKSPVWVIFMVLMLSPISFISGFMFLILFVVIDKTDEFQLMKFILLNKSTQFVSQGLFRTFAGFFLFFNCVTTPANELDHKCEMDGPGQWGPWWLILFGWILQIGLAWLAFLLLPCTNPSTYEEAAASRSVLVPAAEDEEAPRAVSGDHWKHKLKERSARLHRNLRHQDMRHERRFIIYDLVVSALMIAFVAWQLSSEAPDSYLARQTIFACQVTYGFLSLPWFILTLPGVQKAMLHCKKTAYDEKGRCRWFRGAEVPKPESTMSFSLSSEDTDGLMGRMIALVSGEEVKDAHEWKPVNRNAKKCKNCRIRMRDAKDQGQKCKQCKSIFCMACSKQELHCAKKLEQLKAAEASEKETAGSRFERFTQNFAFTSGMVSAILNYEMQDSEKLHDCMKHWMKKHSSMQVEALVDRIPLLLKWSLDDNDMPGLVRQGKDKAVDVFWKDLREEILYQTQAYLSGELPPTEEKDDSPGVDCIRASIRHSELPYNRSIMWQVKRPVWWLMRAIPLIPWGGVAPLFFLMLFIVIDKSDEFQLVNFIIYFKGTLFLSHGLIKNIIGFYTYLGCLSGSEDGMTHTCHLNGPGVQAGWRVFEVMFSGWILQILLVWSAYFLLPLSKDKGRAEIVDSDSEEETFKAKTPDDQKEKKKKKGQRDVQIEGGLSAGGKLRYLLFWDMAIFAICLGIMIWLLETRGIDWVTIQSFFACQVMYGYMSLPFFIFNLPVIREAMTHSVQSGYDRKGRIRALEAPPAKDPKELEEQYKWLEEEQRRLEDMQEEEEEPDEGFVSSVNDFVDGFFSMVKGLFGFSSDSDAATSAAKDDGAEEQSFFQSLAARVGLGGAGAAGESPKAGADGAAAPAAPAASAAPAAPAWGSNGLAGLSSLSSLVTGKSSTAVAVTNV